jgi:EAL domain-containing protein (putative c-di-GMP-specific phosphodiesterase class I)/DNA-binding NarL/FixJ family response regulator
VPGEDPVRRSSLEPPPQEGPSSADPNAAWLTGRPLVLIADDDPSVRRLLQRVLEQEGFGTLLAANGREAIDQIRDHDVAVVLLDLNMPVLNGLETVREIRADDRSRTMPVILVTASDAESDRVKGLESGADDYLAKPFAINELAARVRAHVRGRTAWTHELERGRQDRRRLAAAIDEFPRDGPLVMLATNLVDRLPDVLGVDGVAILHFSRGAVRTIAASSALRAQFPVTKALAKEVGRDVSSRSSSGAWLEAADPRADSRPFDAAYVPFRLGPAPKPLGCLVFARRPGQAPGPLSHRLPDLIDATDFIVAVLRPSVEQAETADAAMTRLRRVIVRREFEIYLQPIVKLDTGAVVAMEALTRFASGVRPDVQFAEAATLGLDLTLQRTTVAAAIQAAASLPEQVALSVNLSAHVLQVEPTLPKILASASRPLIVELTEHERIDDYGAVRTALVNLGPGVRLAIDDAGSGYASLRHIFTLKPDYVKLDIEWVHGIDQDPIRRALVSGLAYFAAETGCQLIAEGIETEAELQAVRELGITLGQGYLLGRPEPGGARQPRPDTRPRRVRGTIGAYGGVGDGATSAKALQRTD